MRIAVVAALASFVALGNSSERVIAGAGQSGAVTSSERPHLTSHGAAGLWSSSRHLSDAARPGTRVERAVGELAAALPREVREQLTHELFVDIAAHGERFLKAYPAEENWFLGMGRSPHPLLGYVEAKEISAAVDYLAFSNGSELQRARMTEQMAALEAKLVQHFVRHMPTAEELGDRNLTLVDFAVSGGTIKVADELFRRAAAERGIPNRQVKVVALRPPRGYARTAVTPLFGVDDFQLIDGITEWTTSKYVPTLFNGIAHRSVWRKETAPVGRFDVMTLEETAGVPTERYRGLVDWLRLELSTRHE